MMLIQHIGYFIVRKIINILPIGLFYLLRSVWAVSYTHLTLPTNSRV